MAARDECKECLLHANGECNERCLQFKRLKRAEYVEQHPYINRKDFLKYLRSLTRFNETDFDLGFNAAISAITYHVEEPEDKQEEKEESKLADILNPLGHVNALSAKELREAMDE